MFVGTINQSFFTYLSVRSNYFKKKFSTCHIETTKDTHSSLLHDNFNLFLTKSEANLEAKIYLHSYQLNLGQLPHWATKEYFTLTK